MQRSEGRAAPINGSVTQRAAYQVPEVAILLGGVTERYVWRLISSGELQSFKVGRLRMVSREQIDTFISALEEDERKARAAAVA